MAGSERPKIFENGKDMLLSLAVIVVGMLAVVGGTGLCSINPETSDLSAVREVDGAAFLDLEARAAQGEAIRIPDVPEDWVSNSARRASVANQPSSVVGWVTPEETYLSSWQTHVSLEDALNGFDEHFREETEPSILMVNMFLLRLLKSAMSVMFGPSIWAMSACCFQAPLLMKNLLN